jgi:hypothetical protein
VCGSRYKFEKPSTKFRNSRLKLLKSKLELSNFLWLDNAIPMELSDILFPEQQIENTLGNLKN